ncbi:MAG: YceI family protein [Cryomorphaceae bacterium]
MQIKHIAGLVFSSFLLTSCGGAGEQAKPETSKEAEAEVTKETCTYSYSDAPVEVLWVAYKYTDKTGVKGKFEESTVTPGGKGTVVDALTGAQVSIATASSNSGDPTRDPKIDASFFGKLENGASLSGVINSANGDDISGTVSADITMNGQTKPIDGVYKVNNATVELRFELNVETWSANEALDELNKVCEDLHKGADGKSVLWPDVTVFVTAALNKECK